MDRIYNILTELCPEFDFRSSKDFIADGMLDSFAIISLIAELEENFGILIDALDIVPENFCGVEAIAQVVRKNGGSV